MYAQILTSTYTAEWQITRRDLHLRVQQSSRASALHLYKETAQPWNTAGALYKTISFEPIFNTPEHMHTFCV
jgi:hypothetical protein